MRKLKKAISLFLCAAMLLPTNSTYGAARVAQGNKSISRDVVEERQQADPEREESLEDYSEQVTDSLNDRADSPPRYQETVRMKREDPPRYQETVKLDGSEEWDGQLAIYWNPEGSGTWNGGSNDSASYSNATLSNLLRRNIGTGSDHADGLTPAKAVKNLTTALRKAERLSQQMDVDISEVTIYAMKPMVVSEGVTYYVDGNGATIMPWEERANESDLLFVVDGGLLVLNNLELSPFDGGKAADEADLIYVSSGKVRLDEMVQSYGTMILDYKEDQNHWQWSTDSNAKASSSEVNRYTAPIIELGSKFSPVSNYYIELNATGNMKSVTAVDSVYSDATTVEEFKELFTLVETDEHWDVKVEERIGGVLRDTTEEVEEYATISESTPAEVHSLIDGITRNEDTPLTHKTLVALRTPRSGGNVIYWNPGPGFSIGGNDYFGRGDGTEVTAPVTTWEQAKQEAKRNNTTTIVCMQKLEIGPGAENYITFDSGKYIIDGDSNLTYTITPWELLSDVAFAIPEGQELYMERVLLQGNSVVNSSLVDCTGGRLILEHDVQTASANIRVSLNESYRASKLVPLVVKSESVQPITVLAGGVQQDISWRFYDIVAADGELLGTDPEAAGQKLKEMISLDPANTTPSSSSSGFAWELRQDTNEDIDEDPSIVNRHHLELYTTYYFDAVYLDGVNGNNSNFGSSCIAAVRDFQTAYAILDREINRSVQARRDAVTAEERDKISIPRTIYICGTVTVDGSNGPINWRIPVEYRDENNQVIDIEIKTHLTEGVQDPVHTTPTSLIRVKGNNAVLTLGKGIYIRNLYSHVDGYTASVSAGGTLNIEEDAVITGLRVKGETENRTNGTHILVGRNPQETPNESRGTLNLATNWTGSIDGKQFGVKVFHSDSRMTMANGEIKNHRHEEGPGSGVMIDQGQFIMTGGSIAENTSFTDGAGVYLSNGATFLMRQGNILKNQSLRTGVSTPAYGVGVYVGPNCKFEMGVMGQQDSLCVISEQRAPSLFYGVGIYIAAGATFDMYSGTVSKNYGIGSSTANIPTVVSRGGGICNQGSLMIHSGEISDNGAMPSEGNTIIYYNNIRGAGIFLGGTATTLRPQQVTNAKIFNNYTGTAHSSVYFSSSIYSAGGGICVETASIINQCEIYANRSLAGGGIAAPNANAALMLQINGGNIRGNLTTADLFEENSSRSVNISGYGGGLYAISKIASRGVTWEGNRGNLGGAYHSYAYVQILEDCTFKNNSAIDMGGGLSLYSSTVYLKDSTVTGNIAGGLRVDGSKSEGKGGGIYSSSGTIYVNGLTLNSNQADEGGGLYNVGATLHISDRNTSKVSSIKDNQANLGGGIYQQRGYIRLELSDSSAVKNQAVGDGAQGNNIYLSQNERYPSDIHLLAGVYEQPDAAVSGVYNIYMDSIGSAAAILYLRPNHVRINSIGQSDALYLNTTNNYLKYYEAPAAGRSLPISVSDSFGAGSVLVKPANVLATAITYPALNTGTSYYESISSSTIMNSGGALKTAVGNMSYPSGGRLPERTHLGAFADSITVGLTNLVLLGDGVYVKQGGNDSNSGTSPDTAVRTFARAKTLLRNQISAAEAGSSVTGAAPFIYICGTMEVNSSQTWELNYEDPAFISHKYNAYEQSQNRVPEKTQIKRFASFVDSPMVRVSGNNVTLTVNNLIMDGGADAVIAVDQGARSPMFMVQKNNTMVINNKSNIRNNATNMVEVYGKLYVKSSVPDNPDDYLNQQIEVTAGDGVNIYDGAYMELDGYARVSMRRPRGMVLSTSLYYNQGNIGRGVVIAAGGELLMKQNSTIAFMGTEEAMSSSVLGALLGSSTDQNLNKDPSQQKHAVLNMQDNASINDCYFQIGLENYNVKVNMSGNTALAGGYYGIYGYTRGIDDITINMSDHAAITGLGSTAFYLSNMNRPRNPKPVYVDEVELPGDTQEIKEARRKYLERDRITLNMRGDAAIRDNQYGLYTYQYNNFIQIKMEDSAALEGNRSSGIYEGSQGCYGIHLDMSGNSRIGATATAQQLYGIRTDGYSNSNIGSRTGDYRIRMSDNAVIGGDSYAGSAGAKSGNSYSGIMTSGKPIMLLMSGDSKISYNGNGSNTGAVNSGVYMARNNFPANSGGETEIKLEGNASICNNSGAGIYSLDKAVTVGDVSTYYLHETIELKGNSSIVANKANNFFMPNSDVYLLKDSNTGKSPLLGNPDPSTVTPAISAVMYGKLYMDGSAAINGDLQLMEVSKPITLLSAVPTADPEGKFELYLTEHFIGQIVVQPQAGNTLFPDVSSELKYFTKGISSGLVAEKDLVAAAPDIRLEGEKNIYISGTGIDTNSGISPANAVRTFKRAKELLEGINGGFYDGESNIYICGTTVVVEEGDEEWILPEHGITNSKSNVTWSPAIYRNPNFSGVMIEVNQDALKGADHVTFKNLTIDGQGDLGAIANNNNVEKTMLKITSGKATLDENAVLQNNRTNANNYFGMGSETHYALGVNVQRYGRLTINGGTIQNMILENVRNNETSQAFDLGVAIYNFGIVEFNDGWIKNNRIEMANRPDSTKNAAIILNKGSGTEGENFQMSGGVIQDNEIIPGSANNETMAASSLMFMEHTYGHIKGGEIVNNKGVNGSAIYFQSEPEGNHKFEIEGGRIRNNTPYYGTAIGKKSGIYVAGKMFCLKGSGCAISDSFYLDSNEHLITVSKDLDLVGGNIRKYDIYLNTADGYKDPNPFDKGSAVVQPDRNNSNDVTQFLVNFEVHQSPFVLDRGKSNTRPAGTIDGLIEGQCLILMQAVFIDSSKSDSNDGLDPEQAVATFQRAKAIGEGDNPYSAVKDYYIIFVSGMVEPEKDEVWELNETSYMCRYTGFTVYDSKGVAKEQQHPHYTGYMIQPKEGVTLTLRDLLIYGRRNIDDTNLNGDSIISVLKDSVVTMESGTSLSRNYNYGSYWAGSVWLPLSRAGGAATVHNGGLLEITGGSITDVQANTGNAIYQEADTQTPNSTLFGHVRLTNSPTITGDIYLDGSNGYGEAYLEIGENYAPPLLNGSQTLSVRIMNDYSGRPVVLYQTAATPTDEQVSYYGLDDSVKAVYDFGKSAANPHMLILKLRQIYYVNGQGGSPTNDGSSPEKAFNNIRKVYEALQNGDAEAGAMVFIVDTVDIDADVSMINEQYIQNGEIHYRGTYKDTVGADITIPSQLYFKRYSQPDSTTRSGFMNVDSNYKTLFRIKDGATLNLNGLYLDGHSQRYESEYDYLRAKGMEAKSPLITVEPGATLNIHPVDTAFSDPTMTRVSTPPLLANNKNGLKKELETNRQDYEVGNNAEGEMVYEASSAGIEVISDYSTGKTGKIFVETTEFRNLELADGVTGGSDIYLNGEMSAAKSVVFSGSVFLEGLGDSNSPGSSRYIYVHMYGRPFSSSFQTKMRDAYNTRKVIEYEMAPGSEPADNQAGSFLLEEHVNKHFVLRKRTNPSERNIFELAVPNAVYIDGQNGNNAADGYYPTSPVKDLVTAYAKLRDSGGKVIYVVDTVEISTDITLSGKALVEGGSTVELFVTTDHVDIRRYAKPTAGIINNPEKALYDRESFTDGSLFQINNGASLTLRENIYIDGHNQPKIDVEYTDQFRVEAQTDAIAPLIDVKWNGKLILEALSYLDDNKNVGTDGDSGYIPGGAIYNEGEVVLNGALIGSYAANQAKKGAGIYQKGKFEISLNPAGIRNQEIYLASQIGTADVWSDHRIELANMLPNTLKLNVNMDHAVAGRPVAYYTDDTETDFDVDAQHARYTLGTTVPTTLFLVENRQNDQLLELQDWRVLDVSVPDEIFLAIQKRGSATAAVADGASNSSTLKVSPEYEVKNLGRYKVKVSLANFVNDNIAATITAFDPMNLVSSAAAAESLSADKKDIYLAILGVSNTNFAALGETSLHSYGTGSSTVTQMGILEPTQSGKFTFKAAVSRQFMDYYNDNTFPFYGSMATTAERKKHYRTVRSDNSTVANNARAKYKMTYRLEIIRD